MQVSFRTFIPQVAVGFRSDQSAALSVTESATVSLPTAPKKTRAKSNAGEVWTSLAAKVNPATVKIDQVKYVTDKTYSGITDVTYRIKAGDQIFNRQKAAIPGGQHRSPVVWMPLDGKLKGRVVFKFLNGRLDSMEMGNKPVWVIHEKSKGEDKRAAFKTIGAAFQEIENKAVEEAGKLLDADIRRFSGTIKIPVPAEKVSA